MLPKRHIVWSTDNIELNNEFQKKWYIKQVLTNGRAEDIKKLDWEEVKRVLPDIVLPRYIRKLWENCLNVKV